MYNILNYCLDTLLIRRTCSENMNIQMHLNHVCQTESYGNGELCMCSSNLCNCSAFLSQNHVLYALSIVFLHLCGIR